jgi:hypothetical protein
MAQSWMLEHQTFKFVSKLRQTTTSRDVIYISALY